MSRKHSFPPVVNDKTRLLILGSLPGDRSLALQQYYGHPQNKFWELLGQVINVDLRALAYEARLEALLAHGIGLWDVVAEAEREGSLDTAIRIATPNAIDELAAGLPRLSAIAFNGATAARLGRKQCRDVAERASLIDLPSSSPAHTIGFERKLQTWLQLTQFL
ncbi:MAG: DNA-deoxyinosine glycosylase [Burkholderiales bacterium]|nr:DNA-deoxyinosine glycosylase [Burkholderiales bacterium]